MSDFARRFAPGDWYAVVGEDVTVLLPATERTRAASLWQLADAGTGAEDLLEEIVAGGLRGLGDLVLLDARDQGTTRVLVRGRAQARLETDEGPRVVRAAPGTTWTDEIVSGVTGWQVQVATDSGAGSTQPLLPGIAMVSRVEWSPATQEQGRDAEPAPAPEPVPPPAPEFAPVPEASAPEAVAEPTPVADPASPDQDGLTQAGTPVPGLDRPVIPGQEHAPPVVSQPVATLVFSTGEVLDVDRAVLVGRAPEARRFASHDQPQLVTVASPNQEISSTHLEIRPGAGADHGMAIVTDLGSTNGTVLAQPGLPPEELQPGIAVSLIPGAVLDLGDGVTIQVTNA